MANCKRCVITVDNGNNFGATSSDGAEVVRCGATSSDGEEVVRFGATSSDGALWSDQL